MKTLLIKSIFLTLVFGSMVTYSAVAQRVIKGTVYREGKVQAGVTVGAHKTSETFMTSFDGVYEITVPSNSKYLTFNFINDKRKVDIEDNPSNEIDFSFDGIIPEAADDSDQGAILKTSAELVAAGDKDYMSTYTLEKQLFDQKNYKAALPHWRTLYKKYPKSTLNIYLHGISIYENLIENTTDLKIKGLYVDTLMQIYDKRIKHFDQKGYILGRQGTDYLRYKLVDNENMTDEVLKPILKKGYNYVEESVKLQGMESEAPVLILFMQSTRGLFGLGELPKEKVIENYDIASKIIGNALQKDPASNNYIIARDNVDLIFQASGAADCEALISIYTPKFDQIAANIEDLKKMIRMLDRQGCDASPLYAKASDKLYSLEPSAEAAYNMARMYIKANDHDKAETYLKQAIDMEKDPLNLAKYYYAMGTLNQTSDPQQAKTYLQKAIENNPQDGKSYLLLADVYTRNSKSIGETDVERSFVYMLGVDLAQKAKRVDPSVEAQANEAIGYYTQHFPMNEDIFMNGLTVGQTVTVGGWIGEKTTLRERK